MIANIIICFFLARLSDIYIFLWVDADGDSFLFGGFSLLISSSLLYSLPCPKL